MRKLLHLCLAIVVFSIMAACNSVGDVNEMEEEEHPQENIPEEETKDVKLHEDDAVNLLIVYKERFQSLIEETGEDQRLTSFTSFSEVQSYFEEVLSPELSAWLVDSYIEKKEDGLYLIAKDGPTWLAEDEEFEYREEENGTYTLVQERNNEFLGHVNYIVRFKNQDNKWRIDGIEIEQLPEASVEETANIIVEALANKNMELVAQHVHPTKGLLFSPYVYVEEDAVTFEKNEISQLLEDNTVYHWGAYDGSGHPIDLTTTEYVEQFVYDAQFEAADEILVDQNKQRGNTINNIREVFDEAKVVEFYIRGSEDMAEMDWKSLHLVFQQDENLSWKLVALVHDQWTI